MLSKRKRRKSITARAADAPTKVIPITHTHDGIINNSLSQQWVVSRDSESYFPLHRFRLAILQTEI